jgi:transposase
MPRQTKRVLTDAHWQHIAPLLPEHPRSPKGGRPWCDDRECLEGILWLLRNGGRWCDIPIDLPSPSTCWRRLHAWANAGILQEIHTFLIQELDDLGKIDLDELLADATFIRAKKGAPTWEIPRLARA